MNGNRHNGFGARLNSRAIDVSRALSATREQVERQGPDRAFDTTPATRQWTCTNGHANPASRSTCRFCGETGGAA